MFVIDCNKSRNIFESVVSKESIFDRFKKNMETRGIPSNNAVTLDKKIKSGDLFISEHEKIKVDLYLRFDQYLYMSGILLACNKYE